MQLFTRTLTPLRSSLLAFFLLTLRLSAADVAADSTPAGSQKPASSDEKFRAALAKLWSLQPVRATLPPEGPASANPIDAFIRRAYREKGLRPVGKADKLTLLRRVSYDLTGLPPTPDEQEEFLKDEGPKAWETLVDRLLASEQYGVRWTRHWMDVLRYADQDSGMPAASGIYLWRDWMISALNDDIPYDDFVRAQLLGNRNSSHTSVTALGYRQRVPGPMADSFALGFLARGALTAQDKEQDLALSAAETVSTAFMGMTVGCAKCHDHKFDPIRQKDFYAMKALFDPLVPRKVALAGPAEIFANGRATREYDAKKAPLDAEIEAVIAPSRATLYEERVQMLTPDVQAVIRKPEKQRTLAEQKTADDYSPILRIDPAKIKEVLAKDELAKYNELLAKVAALKRPADLPTYWTVEEDELRLKEPSYILTSGDPARPEKDKPVEPGVPFSNGIADFREGRREGFADWLTARENPLFARVAVNRVWAWHFGEGLQRVTSDFGLLGGKPSNQPLLDYLAAQFVEHHYSMKWLHRLIVTSETYQLSSKADAAALRRNTKADARNTYLWHFRLQRLEAEPIWDTILSTSGDLDLSVGGKSFQFVKADPQRPAGGGRGGAAFDSRANRRAVYMARGFSANADVMPNFLTSFDVDDGRTPCPIRTQTVTAPQALFSMNDDFIEKATDKFAARTLKSSSGDIKSAVDLAFRAALGRPPTPVELDKSLTYVNGDPARMKQFAWLLFNLDEFIYVR
jgi:hypothetical protein